MLLPFPIQWQQTSTCLGLGTERSAPTRHSLFILGWESRHRVSSDPDVHFGLAQLSSAHLAPAHLKPLLALTWDVALHGHHTEGTAQTIGAGIENGSD